MYYHGTNKTVFFLEMLNLFDKIDNMPLSIDHARCLVDTYWRAHLEGREAIPPEIARGYEAEFMFYCGMVFGIREERKRRRGAQRLQNAGA